MNGVYFFPTFFSLLSEKMTYFYLLNERNDVIVYYVISLRPEQRVPDALMLYGHKTASLLIPQSYKTNGDDIWPNLFKNFPLSITVETDFHCRSF